MSSSIDNRTPPIIHNTPRQIKLPRTVLFIIIVLISTPFLSSRRGFNHYLYALTSEHDAARGHYSSNRTAADNVTSIPRQQQQQLCTNSTCRESWYLDKNERLKNVDRNVSGEDDLHENWDGSEDNHSIKNKSRNEIPRFWENSSRCFVFDNVCRLKGTSTESLQWFYFANDKMTGSPQLSQPSALLNMTYELQRWGRAILGPVDSSVRFSVISPSSLKYPASINYSDSPYNTGSSNYSDSPHYTDSPNVSTWTTMPDLARRWNCSLSAVENHVVLQSAYNGMIGEFYMRTLIGWNQLLSTVEDWDSVDFDIKIYLHLVESTSSLLDAHKLFMSGMPFGRTFEAWSDALARPSCDCYRKLVLCGYESYSQGVAPQDDFQLRLTPSSDLVGAPACEGPPGDPSFDNCRAFSSLRNILLRTFRRIYPSLDEDVATYRTLLIQNALPDHSSISHQNWTILGLAQRIKRRSWLNLPDALHHCHLPELRLFCVEVNVESSSLSSLLRRPISPEYEQLIVHRSLDALVGIHGAQLTQGVLLPQGSLLVELLPWLPPQVGWGRWTRQTNRPTPLGILYHNVHLNHVGYSLEEDSVPFCQNETTYSSNMTRLDCMLANPQFRWDARNFNVPLRFIDELIHAFYNQTHNPLANSCQDLRRRSETHFVLYNVICQMENETNGIHHFYQ